MNDAANVIGSLLQERQFEAAQMFVQWRSAIEEDREKRVARAISPILRRDFPDTQGEVFQPPSGLTFSGKDKVAQIIPGSFTIQTRFSKDYRSQANLALGMIEKKWRGVYDALRAQASSHFFALLISLEVSTRGKLNPYEFLSSFIRPTRLGKVVDSEWRIAFTYADRYFINFAVSVYKKLDIVVETRGGVFASTQSEKDEGLTVKIDVNTKYAAFHGLPESPLTEQDFSEVLRLTRKCIDEDLLQLLSNQ
jgi:hypothetical protein